MQITSPPQYRRDIEKLYNKMTVADLYNLTKVRYSEEVEEEEFILFSTIYVQTNVHAVAFLQ